MKRLCLVDVSAMYFRAFYAIRPLSNSAGLPTNALYGFLSMTGKMLRELKPDYLAYCFDRKDGSFRNEMYKEYKANRSEMPDDLKPQVPYIKKLTEAMNIPVLEKQGFEADDIIGMLSELGSKEEVEVIIVSSDKDFAQLITEDVKMFDPMKEILYDPKKVLEKWEVNPSQFIDYLSIVGDASDNIPGVKGVGPKGAVKLLTEFKDLDGIYANVDSIQAKAMKQKIIDNKELAYMSKELVTIVRENKTDIQKVKDLKWSGMNFGKLDALLEELEFHNIGKRLRKDTTYLGNSDSVEGSPELPSSKQTWSDSDLESLELKEVDDISQIPFLQNKEAPICMFLYGERVCIAQEKSIYSLPAEALGKGSSILQGFHFIGHGLKNLWRSFSLEGSKASFDTLIAEYLLTSKSTGFFDTLAEKYFHLSQLASPKDYYLALIEVQKILSGKLKETDCEKVFYDIELPTLEVLSMMEKHGICLDAGVLASQSENLKEISDNLKAEIFEITGQEFNLDSPKQLGKVLFDDMGLPVLKKTKTGYSTNSDVLEKLKKKYPWTAKIISYRELKKLLSTYLDALPHLVHADTGRLHTHFNQAVTATGRLSSTEPNLQNIPIRTDYGNAIREAFVAPESMVLVSADYSQIELRLLAHISEDPGLITAFKEDRDIHTATASEVFEVDFASVDSEMRRRAKAVNFGIAYGMGAFSLADNLGISRKEAKDIIDRYFTRFRGVKNYMSDIVELAKEKTYVESIFGRRRYVPELQSNNAILRKNGERIAINSPMQASASDIVKKAMVELGYQTGQAKLLLQVHDELIYEVPENEADELIVKLKTVMENVVSLKVPLKVNASKGVNWREAH